MQSDTGLVLVVLAACCTAASQFDFDTWVMNGEKAAAEEFSYMASLRSSSGSHFCGGSILNANWILTAAQCVVGSSPSSVNVVTGSLQLNSGGNKNTVSKIITHAQYDPNASWKNDIALLKLSSPLQLSSTVQPVKLPAQDKDQAAGLDVVVSGWGYTKYQSRTLPNELQILTLKLVSNSACQASHSETIYDTSVCTSAGDEKGVCNGDSGGPLVETATGEQAGVVSWGRPCARGVPDVYTRVAKYINWINQNIN